ncbi:hypothetical protein E2C01_078291 [Portunus trituberculatus]|uniref:Uncharacterized protein n=1 Tax=Portunus trituberculatus TaxID=210409 RepID=A0A5B7ING0_PORTR|nr:hypothetical protein [Portunus trituberculatus]
MTTTAAAATITPISATITHHYHCIARNEQAFINTHTTPLRVSPSLSHHYSPNAAFTIITIITINLNDCRIQQHHHSTISLCRLQHHQHLYHHHHQYHHHHHNHSRLYQHYHHHHHLHCHHYSSYHHHHY